MNDEKHDATPPITPDTPAQPRTGGGGRGAYDDIADTVGFVPNVRVKDNVVQAIVVFATAVLGFGLGWALTGELVAGLVGIILGLIGGLLVSGIVLMVLGWIRAAKRRGG